MTLSLVYLTNSTLSAGTVHQKYSISKNWSLTSTLKFPASLLSQLKFPFNEIVIIINGRMMFHDQKPPSRRRREGADDDYDKYKLKYKWKYRKKCELKYKWKYKWKFFLLFLLRVPFEPWMVEAGSLYACIESLLCRSNDMQ